MQLILVRYTFLSLLLRQRPEFLFRFPLNQSSLGKTVYFREPDFVQNVSLAVWQLDINLFILLDEKKKTVSSHCLSNAEVISEVAKLLVIQLLI